MEEHAFSALKYRVARHAVLILAQTAFLIFSYRIKNVKDVRLTVSFVSVRPTALNARLESYRKQLLAFPAYKYKDVIYVSLPVSVPDVE